LISNIFGALIGLISTFSSIPTIVISSKESPNTGVVRGKSSSFPEKLEL